jgi:predicted nucleotide-binding protein with TIR-like domain
MERCGQSRNLIRLSIDDDVAERLRSKLGVEITLELLQVLANKCLAHKWLEQTVHGGKYSTLALTATGLDVIHSRQCKVEALANGSRLKKVSDCIEKVEAHGNVGFAVVLLTPDDEGSIKGGAPQPRARQNVLLELGYFIGHLGRKHVCALKRGELEIPSDFGGVVYEAFDASGGWKQALGRELEAAGYSIDWNEVMRS